MGGILSQAQYDKDKAQREYDAISAKTTTDLGTYHTSEGTYQTVQGQQRTLQTDAREAKKKLDDTVSANLIKYLALKTEIDEASSEDVKAIKTALDAYNSANEDYNRKNDIYEDATDKVYIATDESETANQLSQAAADVASAARIIYEKIVLKSQFNMFKTKLHDISVQENDNTKVAMWNTYYYKKYKTEGNVLIYIIVVCILINILTFLHKNYEYFDLSAYLIMVGFIISISILVVLYAYIQIYSRDDMNFDEYDHGTGNNSKIQTTGESKGYVDVSFNDASNCSLSNRDPKNLANSNFLKQLF